MALQLIALSNNVFNKGGTGYKRTVNKLNPFLGGGGGGGRVKCQCFESGLCNHAVYLDKILFPYCLSQLQSWPKVLGTPGKNTRKIGHL